MGKVILKVSNLGKSYNKGKTFTVSDVSFSVEEGQIVGLVGRNGVGKSTIIKSITINNAGRKAFVRIALILFIVNITKLNHFF